jgi:hypothetical protein
MSTLTEKRHTGEFIIGEEPNDRSREIVTLLSGQTCLPGDVLGKVDVGTAVATALASNTGNGVMGAVTVTAGAKPGTYTLEVRELGSNAGKFIVRDPDGIFVAEGTVASAFAAGGLSFTLADGSTDFAIGDGFKIVVAAGSGKYVVIDKDFATGGQKAAAVAYDAVDASAADADCVAIVRDAVCLRTSMGFGDLDSGQQTTAIAQLNTLGIIVREGN